MSDVTISYNGSSIATMDSTSAKKLLTKEKVCDGDISVVFAAPAVGTGTVSIGYNGQTIATINTPGTKIIPVNGKLCRDDISIGYEITETANGAIRARTLFGADGLPVKSATVTQTDGTPTTWILRRCGKNLLDISNVICEGYRSFNASTGLLVTYTSGAYVATATYIPVVPNTRLVSQGIGGKGYAYKNRIAFYGADKTFISTDDTTASNADYAVSVPANAFFFRFVCPLGLTTRVGATNYYYISSDAKIQFEILDIPDATPADATAYAAYNGVDIPVAISALNTPVSISPPPATLLGQNVFSLFPQGALNDANPTQAIDIITETATMDLTYYIDPSLA